MAAFSAPPIGCLLMAAGNASRFGENKLTARFDGQSLFSRALEAIPAGVFVRVTVVSQYPSLLEEASQAGFDAILNDRPEDGISRTIRLGTRAMADCAGILYMVADQPLLQAGTVRRIVDAWQEHPNCITAAAHNGKRGNPCLFPSRFSRNCVHWRQTVAAHPSFGGTKMRCCSSRQENANCSTATQSRRWKF